MKKISKVFVCFLVFITVSGCSGKENQENPGSQDKQKSQLENVFNLESEDGITILEQKEDITVGTGNFIAYKEKGVYIYGYYDEKFVEVPLETLDSEITFLGITGTLKMKYCTYGEESWIVDKNNSPITVGDDEYDLFVTDIKDQKLYLEIGRNAQKEEWIYPFIYDLQTNEITDFLEEVQIEEKKLTELFQLSMCNVKSFEDQLYVSSNDEIYKIDLKDKSAISLNKLVDEEKILTFQILEDGYFLIVPGEEDYQGIYYDNDTEKKEIAFEQIAIGEFESEDLLHRVRLIGNTHLLIKRNGDLYCRNQETKEEWKIKEYDNKDYYINDIIGTDKALLEGRSEGEENDYWAVLDLEDEKLIEIKTDEKSSIKGVSLWDEDSILVQFETGLSEYKLVKYELH